jgi:hypothetical protein
LRERLCTEIEIQACSVVMMDVVMMDVVLIVMLE